MQHSKKNMCILPPRKPQNILKTSHGNFFNIIGQYLQNKSFYQSFSKETVDRQIKITKVHISVLDFRVKVERR